MWTNTSGVLTRWSAGLLFAAALLVAARISRAADEQPKPTAAFEQHLKDYLAMHRRLEATLPKLPKEASPEQIDKNQRALFELIRKERKGAKQGEFFDHAMQRLVRESLIPIFKGPDGEALKASIMDENPGIRKLTVNARYPDDVPLSTMPPDILKALPALEEDMEYRFVDHYFVLFDAHAHLIVDYMDDVMPS